MYKLVAIDLDGTMLNQYGVVTQRTKEAIKKKLIYYHIVTEEEPSELRDKNGDQIDGMVQMILKYNLA